MATQSNSWLRNLLILFVLIQLAPAVFKTIKQQYTSLIAPKTKVGILSVKGTIIDTSAHVKHLKEFCEDDEIKGIVLKIESPGGAPGASQSLYTALREMKLVYKKPVIAWIQNMGTSGAYYIAAAADRIIAPPSALVGSIGVYLALPYLKEFVEQFKARYTVIKAGAYKTAGNPLVDLTPEQHTMLQELCNSTYQQFLHDILTARPQLSALSPDVWANGRIFDAAQALRLGLVDATGSSLTVEAELKQLAHIETDIEWVHPPRPSAWARFLCPDDSSEDEEHPYIASLGAAIASQLTAQLQQQAAPRT